jgi:hypothetical protein
MRIPRVRLNYCLSWYDFNIDHPPPPILVWLNRAEIYLRYFLGLKLFRLLSNPHFWKAQ